MPRTKGTGAWKPADGDDGLALCEAFRHFAKELFKGDFYTSMKMRTLMHVDPRGGLFTQEHEAFNIMQQDDGFIKGRATACDDEGSANVTLPLRKHGIL